MKKVISIVALSLLLSTPALASYDDFNKSLGESGYSPVVHYTIGAVTSGLIYHYLPEDWNLVLRGLTALSAAFALGAGIESLDQNWSNEDFFDYGVGGVVGIVGFVVYEW